VIKLGLSFHESKTDYSVSIAEADISVCVLSAESLLNGDTGNAQEYIRHISPLLLPTTLVFVNKTDTITSTHNSLDVPSLFSSATLSSEQIWFGSLHSQEGMASFVSGIASVLQTRFSPAGSPLQADDGSLPLITHARHRAHLESAVNFLDAFIAVGGQADLVVAAEELRYAAHAIGRVTGAIGAEDVLDAVFGSFCIGK
jgi:tRNA modification GTPase